VTLKFREHKPACSENELKLRLNKPDSSDIEDKLSQVRWLLHR
jgi:hypothetical protein